MKAVLIGIVLLSALLTTLYLNFNQVEYKQYQTTRTPTIKPITISETPIHTLTSLEDVFNERAVEIPEDSLSIIFVGDIMLGRKVNVNTIRYNNFNWPFEEVARVLSDADVTVVNLEGPLVYNCPTTTEGFKFCGDSRHVSGLAHSGIDIANLANNHSRNYGIKGTNETKEILSKVGMHTFDEEETLLYEFEGKHITFLGYDVVFQESDPLIPTIKADVLEATNKSDLVIVSFHWGDEYTNVPNYHQINLAHAAIDAGADLIIGHHPHWIQTAEFYKDKLILYSLGNFVFDQMWSQETREGLGAKLIFDERRLIKVELMPVLIENYGQPHFLEGDAKFEIIEGMKIRSSEVVDNRTN